MRSVQTARIIGQRHLSESTFNTAREANTKIQQLSWQTLFLVFFPPRTFLRLRR